MPTPVQARQCCGIELLNAVIEQGFRLLGKLLVRLFLAGLNVTWLIHYQ
jgi:hypothetical protein